MKVFIYCDLLLLFCVLQFLVDTSCDTQTHQGKHHARKLTKSLLPTNERKINVPENDLKRERTVKKKRKDSGRLVKEQDETPSSHLQNGQRIVWRDNKIHVKLDLAGGISKKPFSQTYGIERAKGKAIGNKPPPFQKSNFSSTKAQANYTDSHSNTTTEKKTKKLFKKYALFQSLYSLQPQSDNYQPIMTGGDESNEDYTTAADGQQTGYNRNQGFSPDDQQQQPLTDGNSLIQYDEPQDTAGYQQENSQSSVASFVASNNDDTSQNEDEPPSSLEQVIQLQQAAYTQHPQEQGQDQDTTTPSSQDGGLAGQGSQIIDGGQMQYQGEQAAQGQEPSVQEQDQGQSSFDQAGFQQEQPQEIDQQPSQSTDQQQLDQTQEYQQQQVEQQQQPVEEPQESEGTSSDAQSLANSPNSYGSLFSSESQQTAPEQQSQGTLSYATEPSNDASDKNATPGIQYASSIEEALKEPAVSPQENSSEGGVNQESVTAPEGANLINIGPGADSKEGANNGFIGAGSISSPTGYQTSVVDDNGNPIQTGGSSEVSAYSSSYDQAANGAANGFDESQQLKGTSSSETQEELLFDQQESPQQGSTSKVPPLEDDVYKIISAANKNGPTAVKGCKGCPLHARCIDKVCIINDDQPLAHILSALSGPEPDEDSEVSECKECHYNAKCINRECMCKTGYTGDGIDCRPDTCLPGCKQHGKCIKGFCVCDHHHYFNGYECAPYKITHRNCPIQCTTTCHARCPPNCCKHHPVLKIHYNDGNPQQINVPPNTPPPKHKNGPRPTEVVLKPIIKVGEAMTNFAPDFQQRPGNSEETNLEAINLKNPGGGFAVSETDARPLFAEDECPDNCKTECRDTCPVRCCLGKCPPSCAESCKPSCPKTCCYLEGVTSQFPMMDSKVQENFMKTMVDKFCPKACRSKCDSKCPPICCDRNSTSVSFKETNFQHLKSESRNNADFFRNAMSWFGMMNFLNMMYSMYGNLYGSKSVKFPMKLGDHRVYGGHPTKPKSMSAENHINLKQVAVAEKANASNANCPQFCNTTCSHLCPPKCCHDKPKEANVSKVDTPLHCQPSCAWFCSHSCPTHCCSQTKRPLVVAHHPTEPITMAKLSPITPPKVGPSLVPAKPHTACTARCPAYCYPVCLENCCIRGEVPKEPTTARGQGKQSYDNFLAKQPTASIQNCPASCQSNCDPSCPVSCCARTLSAPLPSKLATPSQVQSRAPLCPGGCASECFPACTISCCRADTKKFDPTPNPTRRQNQPVRKFSPFPLPAPVAACHPGCSRSCYPNCDETCCRAAARQSSNLPSPSQLVASSPFTIKVPCPSECRPFNCLYYCHHDCCLQGKETANPKSERRRYQAPPSKDKRKYLSGMRKIKTLSSRTSVVAADRSTFGGRMGKKRAIIYNKPRY